LILLISLSKLKLPVAFSASLVGASISLFSDLLVCLAFVLAIFVLAVCVSAAFVLALCVSTTFVLAACVSTVFVLEARVSAAG
jgi:hypothetical protein